jgi:phospholipase D-like protein
MPTWTDIDRVIQANLPAFKKAGALTVRPGYKIKDGWITNTPAIVVTVDEKRANVNPADAIPPRVGEYPTDVRTATTLQRLRYTNPGLHATLKAAARPEYDQPEFPLERDVQSGNLLAQPAPSPVEEVVRAKPTEPYTPAPGASLVPVTDKMSITCCASPDAGWIELSKFLQNVKQRLTVGIYDFTSAHILQAVQAALKGKQNLSLVLDDPAKNPSADQTDPQTQQALSKALKNRLAFAWAAEARDPMVSKGIFPNAYHIKVAVKDGTSFWLSSGNWNNSNQPEINPFDKKSDAHTVAQVAAKSDRDYHVIVQHSGLAKTFEAYLKHDLEVASQMQSPPAAAKSASAVLAEAKALSPEKPILGTTPPNQYFQPLEITNETITVQPILTPDSGAGNYVDNILKLIQSAKTRLYIQTQYIHPPNTGADQRFQSLIDAVAGQIGKGVDVKIILSEYEATGNWLEKLQQAGIDTQHVKIQNGVHNKTFIVDSNVVAVGSQNWSGDGTLRNRDASLIIHHTGAAQYFEQIFVHDWTVLAKQHLKSQVSTSTQAGAAA